MDNWAAIVLRHMDLLDLSFVKWKEKPCPNQIMHRLMVIQKIRPTVSIHWEFSMKFI